MTTYVFLGPSLSRAQVVAGPDTVILPPAAMGDIYTLVAGRARQGDAIALIDGYFEQVPAVWHKEVLHALSRGMRVYGASSMGALRAAELHRFGMRGVGRIFEAYRDGVVEDDDEVAVAHADETFGYRSLSQAMISLRFAIDDLVAKGQIEPQIGRDLIDHLKALPYAERSWGAAMEKALSLGTSASTVAALRSQARDLDAKALDALALFEVLAREAETERSPTAIDFTFQQTSFWRHLTDSLVSRVEAAHREDGGASPVEDQELAAFYRAGGEAREALLDEALLSRLVAEVARTHQPDQTELRIASHEIAHRNGLADAPAMARWREEQRLGSQQWRRLLEATARHRWARRQFATQLDPFLVRALQARGLYGQVRRAHARVADTLRDAGLHKPTMQALGVEPEDLQRAYEARFGPMLGGPAGHAEHLGFGSLREFIDNLLKHHVAAKDPQTLAEVSDHAG